MRTLITSDLQLADNPRDKYRFDFLRRLPRLLQQQNIDRLYLLGDITEAKDRHSAWLVNHIVGSLATAAQNLKQLVVLRGNHDYLEHDWPFFAFLSELERIRFLAVPTKIDDELFLPHTRDYQQDWQGISFKGVRRILTHNTFAGAIGANGIRLDGIPLDALPNIPIVSGDIHVPQRHGRLTYVGAPYRVDYGDDYEPRALILDGDKMLSLRLRGPQKRLFTVDSVEAAKTALGQAGAGDVVRVKYYLPQNQYPRWAEIQTAIRELCEHEPFILDSVLPEVQVSGSKKIERRHSAPVSDEQVLKAYGQQQQLDQKMLQVGLDSL